MCVFACPCVCVKKGGGRNCKGGKREEFAMDHALAKIWIVRSSGEEAERKPARSQGGARRA